MVCCQAHLALALGGAEALQAPAAEGQRDHLGRLVERDPVAGRELAVEVDVEHHAPRLARRRGPEVIVDAGPLIHLDDLEQAAFPAPWVRENKFRPFVGRIDNPWGDRHLTCTCAPVEEYQED